MQTSYTHVRHNILLLFCHPKMFFCSNCLRICLEKKKMCGHYRIRCVLQVHHLDFWNINNNIKQCNYFVNISNERNRKKMCKKISTDRPTATRHLATIFTIPKKKDLFCSFWKWKKFNTFRIVLIHNMRCWVLFSLKEKDKYAFLNWLNC